MLKERFIAHLRKELPPGVNPLELPFIAITPEIGVACAKVANMSVVYGYSAFVMYLGFTRAQALEIVNRDHNSKDKRKTKRA